MYENLMIDMSLAEQFAYSCQSDHLELDHALPIMTTQSLEVYRKYA